MLGQRARPVRRAGTGKPTPETVHGVPSPTRHLPLDRTDANLVFQVISKRYETGTILLTSNKAFSEWGSVFGDDVLATAILDRLLHHCEVVSINGPSYRLKNRLTTIKGGSEVA
ncbi:IstB-like ATP binding protein [Nonomuraea fuscirosea]|uniref:IstB-like ATP binding protein n=2 Tax=Nonomuraea fuscirosea TaxID=1291556 RepID=A0A2T0LT46_9ACTN|nr:IstB-like ATP binding protein [Nonomuraea fuscirosea]